ncbi:pectin lyase fold/virulence factor [Cadophora sp. MPI-SDFR-AT-0126]|nr:pectin lyase fold/virulence factor [Leotiomycetes sp. MPI-SDFR-AT-0126]
MFFNIISAIVPGLLFSSLVQAAAQVDKTTVGPLTPLSSKSKICNVLDYGAKADNKTDIGPAILSAFSKCASNGGATIYVPPGSYSIATGVNLNKGSAYALQIDGLITLTSNGAFNGNAFVIQNTNDVEVFSSNGLGAINGQGYITRITASGQNARLFRFINSKNIAIHDMIFVDSPTFHLVFNSVSNMEAYHITVHGPNLGGTDGIDVICTDNCYMHDIEVTNRDECISVKSPSNNLLIEDIICNQSGGMSIGSLTADITDLSTAAAVSNITMRNIYTYQCTQMLMIKTYPGGSGAVGYVKDSLFENFWAYDTTYALDIDQYWYNHLTPNTGAIALSSLTFSNWTGTMNKGSSRGAIVIRGSDQVPARDITLSNFNMWTVNGKTVVNQCKNVYGSGYCAGKSTGLPLAAFTTSVTSSVAPAGFTAPVSPAWGVAGYGTNIPIPVYTPAALWKPVSSGVASTSKVSVAAVKTTSTSIAASTKKTSSSSVKATSTKSSVKTSSTIISVVKTSSTTKVVTTSAPVGTIAKYGQCGGSQWTGATGCVAGSTCVFQSQWYSQCL